MAKTPRTNEELVEALRRHVSLLKEYHKKAFDEGDANYYGEVAGKLRLLIYRSHTCHPLLLELMEKFSITVRLDLIGPGNRSADIDEYFNRPCGAFRSERTNQLIEITRMGVVRTWAQQIGSSHEDPSLDDDFSEYLSHGLYINGRQIAVDELHRSSKFVLNIAKFFFDDYEQQTSGSVA